MDNLKIYIDRLKGGHTLKIQETLSPEFLDVKDEELIFKDPVRVCGQAYLADDHLVIHLDIETSTSLPCSICNSGVSSPVFIKNHYCTIPLSEIKHAIFDFTESVRETILLQTPLYAECNKGQCPERENIKKFLKSNEKPLDPNEMTHFPFTDLK